MFAIITVGVSGSGKSTWAEKFVADENYSGLTGAKWIQIERDQIRALLYPEFTTDEKIDWTKYKFTKARESAVTEYVDTTIEYAVHKGYNIVISDTNLNNFFRNNLIDKLVRFGYEVEVKEFGCSLEELWKRNAQRVSGVPHNIVYEQYQRWLKYKGVWKYEPDPSLPKAIALDMDGSLCKRGDRGWFDWDKVMVDTPHKINVDFAKGMKLMGYELIVFTGRDGSCKHLCEEWLNKYGIQYSDIYIRPEGDNRCDSIIKEEILKEAGKKYNVCGVLDDRPRVVRKWHELGLHCWNVGNAWEEF